MKVGDKVRFKQGAFPIPMGDMSVEYFGADKVVKVRSGFVTFNASLNEIELVELKPKPIIGTGFMPRYFYKCHTN